MTSLPSIEKPPGYLKSAIIASLAIHVLVIFGFWKAQNSYKRAVPEISFLAELVVPPPSAMAPKANLREKPSQIVEPPVKSTETPPEDKQVFESDQDNASIKQQIRRGENGAANPQTSPPTDSKPAPTTKKSTPEKTAAKSAPKIEEKEPKAVAPLHSSAVKLKLKLDSDSLADLATDNIESKDEQKNSNQKLQEALQSNLNSNQRSSISLKRSGSQDYLPDIPDGEVTLLNTKANKYAVFVRRVASQVFANLRGAGWRSLSASDIRAISKESIFEAVLSPKGEFISLSLTSSSESKRFDQVLQQAIKNGAKDPNPPKGAEADDGNIHFIFQARSWVQFQPNPRTGTPNERRWLLLGTGLE